MLVSASCMLVLRLLGQRYVGDFGYIAGENQRVTPAQYG